MRQRKIRPGGPGSPGCQCGPGGQGCPGGPGDQVCQCIYTYIYHIYTIYGLHFTNSFFGGFSK